MDVARASCGQLINHIRIAMRPVEMDSLPGDGCENKSKEVIFFRGVCRLYRSVV